MCTFLKILKPKHKARFREDFDIWAYPRTVLQIRNIDKRMVLTLSTKAHTINSNE